MADFYFLKVCPDQKLQAAIEMSGHNNLLATINNTNQNSK